MRKRIASLLLALLMLVSLAPAQADAAGSVCFTATNDTLLPLSGDTMPVFIGGTLYVASAAFDGTDLGISYSRSRDRMTAVLYKQRKALTFDIARGTVDANDGQYLLGAAITRGDVVYFTLDTVCSYFGLTYSYTRISYGYLLRIKNDSAVLSDAAFIDAADAPMAQRYARYVHPQTDEPVQPAEPNPPSETPPPQDVAQSTVFFAIEATDAAAAERVLSRLGSGRAAWLFTAEELDGAGDLLRRLAAGAGSPALRVDASAGAESALAQIEAGNRALWSAASMKTRLVRLDGASEETLRLVTEAGYCPLAFAQDFSDGTASVSNMSARILTAAGQNGGSCCVFLGADETALVTLGALLVSLRAGNCTPAPLNEVTVFQ